VRINVLTILYLVYWILILSDEYKLLRQPVFRPNTKLDANRDKSCIGFNNFDYCIHTVTILYVKIMFESIACSIFPYSVFSNSVKAYLFYSAVSSCPVLLPKHVFRLNIASLAGCVSYLISLIPADA